jgi:hypothetical protein
VAHLFPDLEWSSFSAVYLQEIDRNKQWHLIQRIGIGCLMGTLHSAAHVRFFCAEESVQ